MKETAFLLARVFLIAFLAAVLGRPGLVAAQLTPIERGVGYLRATQDPGGSWGATPSSLVAVSQATATAARSFQLLGISDATLANAVSFLAAQTGSTVEELAGQTEVLAASGAAVSALVTALRSAQRIDRGWGLDLDRVFGSEAIDTIAALRALRTSAALDTPTAAASLGYLISQQNADGGWGATAGRPSEVFYTALALMLLSDFQTVFDLARPTAAGVAFLVGRQNGDGSFGSSGGSAFETSLAVQALLRFVIDPTVVTRSVNYLLQTQAANGSWVDDAYSTALALRALHDIQAADQDLDRDGDGWTKRQGDCNDANPSVNPGAADLTVNGIDEDCNGIDGSPAGDVDADGDGFTVAQGDCNDSNPAVRPGAPDLTVNGVDEDCNGVDGPPVGDVDADGDGFTVAQGDCNDSNPTMYPGAPDLTVNGIDEDCNGVDGPPAGNVDADGDGFTVAQGDCNDTNPSIRPGAVDIPGNGIDEDCTGQDAVSTVRITAVNLFKVVEPDRTPTTTFGAYETMAARVTVDDPAARLVVFVTNTTGTMLSLPMQAGEFQFLTLNHAPGSYELTARAVDSSTGIVLDQRATAFTIVPTVTVGDVIVRGTPAFTHVGATETVAVTLSATNRSNTAGSLTIGHTVRAPSGTVLSSGATALAVTPGGAIPPLTLATFTHRFTESGLYSVEVRVSVGPTLVASPAAALSAAPAIRLDATQSLTPTTVPPEQATRIRLNIRLRGVEQGP